MAALLVEYFGWCRDGIGMLQDCTIKGGCGAELETYFFLECALHLESSYSGRGSLLLILGDGTGRKSLLRISTWLAHHFILLDLPFVLRKITWNPG